MKLRSLQAKDLGYVKALHDMGMISNDAFEQFLAMHAEEFKNDSIELEMAVPIKTGDYSNASVHLK